MNYFISDMHFGCQNKYEGRTLEHDKIITENWNRVVNNNDDVYILGDIGRIGGNKDNEYLCKCISVLKGRKHLILGNHDGGLKDGRLRQLFVEICDYKEIIDNYNGMSHKLVLSHYPIAHFNGQHKGWVHLFGHLHETQENNVFLSYINYFNDIIRNNGKNEIPGPTFNVCSNLSYMNYSPQTLKHIIEYGSAYNSEIKWLDPTKPWKEFGDSSN